MALPEKVDKTMWGNIVDDILHDNFTKHHLSSNLLAQVIEDKHHLPETFYYKLEFLPHQYNDMTTDICHKNDKMATSGATYYVTLQTA
eukprot:12645611-Ditylum_brightwellii.AAC.1